MITIHISNGYLNGIEFDRKDEQYLSEFLSEILSNGYVQFEVKDAE